MIGSEFMARVLRRCGVVCAFGVVGVPVTPLSVAMQQQGTQFIAMRNEQVCDRSTCIVMDVCATPPRRWRAFLTIAPQAASYAASVDGYLRHFPGCCLTVSGPGA